MNTTPTLIEYDSYLHLNHHDLMGSDNFKT